MTGDSRVRCITMLRRSCTSPWFAGITAVVGAVAGLLGAIYADQIKRAFPFYCCAGSLEIEALIFWFAALLFGLMFGSNFWAQSSIVDEQLDELRENTQKLDSGLRTLHVSSQTLEEQIKTLPPKSFLQMFESDLIKCYPIATRATEANASYQDIREGILGVLSGLACLAKLFDGATRNANYSANIMVFRSLAGLSPDEIADFQNRAKFTERQGAGSDGWSGVLELMPHLAVFLGDRMKFDDNRLPRFVMEIPLPEFRKDSCGKSAVLPGAPEAFCERGYTFCPDTFDVAEQCRRERALRPSVSVAMDRYFREQDGQDIRSFVSIALAPSGCLRRTAGAEEEEPIGVINIHSDQPHMLSNRGVELFVPLTAPHKLLISRLMESLLRLGLEAPIKGATERGT
jgi:hypothetical protein